ncbi:hypothetical protein MKW92_045568 [Papaver armeniacum]|nr:hypothetical protein MKW92_045568 [Papaver armeniacum]
MSLLLLFFCTCLFLFSNAKDTMVQKEYLSVNETLVSSGQTFELGFFSINNTKNLYLGIWYKNITPIFAVWIANRNHPLTDSAGGFTITDDGNIAVVNGSKIVIWSSNLSRSVDNPVVQLLETGNLVLKNDSATLIWQSFDYPMNTRLPGMKLGWDLKIGLNRYITSWKNVNDPSVGDYTYGMDLTGLPQLVVRNGSVKKFRSGVWNGLQFDGILNLRPNEIFNYTMEINTNEVYATFTNKGSDPSVITRESMNEEGILQRFIWDMQSMKWIDMVVFPRDKCDNYNYCGVNGICNIARFPPCECLRGFKPISQQRWSIENWTDGCVRNTRIKMPDMVNFLVNKSMSIEECEWECMRNCSCTAYANSDIREGGSGCIFWYGDLLDSRSFSDAGEQRLFLRLALSEGEPPVSEAESPVSAGEPASEGEPTFEGKPINTAMKEKSRVLMKVLLSVGSAVLFFCLVIFLIIWKTRRTGGVLNADETQKEDLDLPLFDLISIEIATNNFSHTNKIGEGGYGPVYKGKTLEGQEIAVKRLSKDSGQGNTEFKNEVVLIAKLQHRNLVKLLGCCIQGEEKILIYEYMPNASLDFFIFDQKRSKLLNWDKRLSIVMGIAKGLLYLHQDSSLRIIHRDLKASNILLDWNMNPKISDFGMARLLGGEQTEAKTERLAGTYGYMSPEYAVDGHFSVKSDVFSFGVLVLEIISGKRNKGFYHDNHHHNLLGHAWILWNEGDPFELMEPGLADSNSASSLEVLRCIQVGLLCVQKLPDDRPSMSAVVFMLSSENSLLLEPKQPGFFVERSLDNHINTDPRNSGNQVTNTLVAR